MHPDTEAQAAQLRPWWHLETCSAPAPTRAAVDIAAAAIAAAGRVVGLVRAEPGPPARTAPHRVVEGAEVVAAVARLVRQGRLPRNTMIPVAFTGARLREPMVRRRVSR